MMPRFSPSITLLTITIYVVSIAFPVHSQVPASRQAVPVLLSGGTIHTQAQGVIQNGMLLLEDGKISGMGTEIQVPENAVKIDISGKQVYPALIHSRNLMGLSEINAVPVTSDFAELGNINPNVRAEVAFHSASTHIGIAAAAGIGTIVSTPTSGIISGLSAAMQTDGWTWDQMTLKASTGLIVNWPDMLENENLDKQLTELHDAFDNARRYHHARKSSDAHPVDVRWEAMRAVFEGEMPVFIHANEISQIQAAISWAEREEITMVLTGARDAGYLASQLAQKNIPVVITPVIGGPARQWEHYGAAYALPAKLHNAGVEFCIAGDFGAASAYRLPFHAASAVAFGLPEDEALKALTLYPARILGLDTMIGSIEPGKDATLIITDGTPLEFATKIEKVFIQGKNIDLENKHRQLYNLYRQKVKQQDNPGENY